MRLPVILVALVSALTCALPAVAQQSQAEGFRGFEIQRVSGSDRYARVRFSDGIRAERFILKAGDCPRSTGDCNADRERIEFFERNPAQSVGSEVWVGWSVYLPPDAPIRQPTSLIFGQFHQRGTSGPELIFQVRDGRYQVKMSDPFQLDDDPMNPIPDFRLVNLITANTMLGRWTRVVVNARWSRGSDGFIRVYVNGRQSWSYDGATTNANDPIYFKYGAYRSFVSKCGGPCPDLVAYYTNVVRGNSLVEVQ